jgi:hypothetical protein
VAFKHSVWPTLPAFPRGQVAAARSVVGAGEGVDLGESAPSLDEQLVAAPQEPTA